MTGDPVNQPVGQHSAATLADAIGDVLSSTVYQRETRPGLLAAVLILLYDRDASPHLVLTKRTDTLAHHPGQVSLPGGRWEANDGDLETTALRETHEELGIAPNAVRIIGRLPDVHTMVSGFVVAPFVGVTTEPFTTTPNPVEIARVMEVPLADVLSRDAELPPDANVEQLRYPLLGEDVWGATARILRSLSAVVRAAIAT